MTHGVERRLGKAQVNAKPRNLLPSSASHGLRLHCCALRLPVGPFRKPTTRGAAPGSIVICCEREVVSWGHPNYPPNNPELPPNNPQRTLKYPSRTPRHPSELHHNYPPTTPQLHPNNPEPPIKTTSGMYQVPQTGAKQAQTGSEVSLSLVGVYTRTLLLPSTCPVGALWDPPFFAHLPKCKHP